ncbi:MAG TPA: alpha/beta hydrolase, partial [Nitrososphaera sp.]|nr:alpha/beta hydrolase [Nitrososphaera sp.]
MIETPSGMGSSVSILCIHGLFCDASIFSYAAGKLSGMGFNVHSMDLPGHGKSYGPPGDLDF